jgi:hypothetical protein
MSLTIENRRFYCTTADVSFGPLFESDDEGEQFRVWMYQRHGDARKFSYDELVVWLAQFRNSLQPEPDSEMERRTR